MKIVESRKIDVSELSNNNEAHFVRIDPEDLSCSVFEILQDLANMSWLNKFDQESVRDSFQSRATKTCKYIQAKLIDPTTNIPLVDKAGEYIVSCLAKKALLNVYSHNDIPLTELIGRKISNNPSFDFYTEKDYLLTAGEAKYIKGINAYNSSLSQINRFIAVDSLDNLNKGHFSVGAAFSATKIESDALIDNILKNNEFQKVIKNHSVYLLAVNMYE